MKKYSGFTLIEMVLVMVIVGVLSVALTTLMQTGMQQYFQQRENIDNGRDVMFTLQRLQNDMVMTAPNHIAHFSMDTLTFKKNDQVVVSYHFSNGLLTREENNSGNSYPLMDTLSAVSGLQFYYFQQDGITAATDSDAIRFIQVYLTTQRGATITRFFQLRNAISINSTGHPKL